MPYKKEEGIYQIRNILNNKVYIGSSSNLRYRRNGHFKSLRRHSHANKHLQRAFNKYGENNFVFEVLEYCTTDLKTKEQFYIDKYQSLNIARGYNISKFTDAPMRGAVLSNKRKAQIRMQKLGTKLSEDTKRKIAEGVSKKYFTSLLSPKGIVYILITNLSEFCRINKLGYGSIRDVLSGKRNQYKGWRICPLSLV